MGGDRKGADDADPVNSVEAILEQLQQRETLVRDVDDAAAAAAARRQLRCLAASVGSNTSSGPSLRSMISALSALSRLCDQKFVTFSYSDILIAWRAIYIDTQLLKACCALSIPSDGHVDQTATLRRCIRDLDLALIVAGATSLSKHQPCHALILALQSRLLDRGPQDIEYKVQPCASSDDTRARKRLKTTPAESMKPIFTTVSQADSRIVEYDFSQAPTFMDLSSIGSTVRSKPFIVRGYAQRTDWSAVQSDGGQGSWSSVNHLLKAAGPARVVPVEVGANYTRADWGQDMMLWSDFLRHCRWHQAVIPNEASHSESENGLGSSHVVIYMAQHDLASQFPALQQDYRLPDYVYTCPSAPKDWPDYKPPATEDGVITNLWVGPAGTISPPHHDAYHNCFVQAVGYKEVWVSSPHLCPRKDVQSPLSSSEDKFAFNKATTKASIAETLMTNTASMDVFDKAVPIRSDIKAAASNAILGPGDLLYMPPGWWHSLRSLTRSFSVSTWF